ncbi:MULTISPECIES: MFS transporter [unclassified Bacillus (in: firmicutes)]|uniref:MFS transporter n=1 Tax=unclassified Bacillus (in: firmicutes) TaxID=185979 RepID=UPI001BE899EE|nr:MULTISPECIES: MFS transporter [unclassified Bacillus (in: firmicutes)]MBT2725039.1 MFS transporter [Bacillus sp. ISL-46]MBT2743419.1 MFS transporter [Bacillus sp. ISL-77]
MPKQKHKGLTITAIGSIPLILVLGNSMLIPILPKMKSELNITQFQTSLIISVFSIAAAISIPVLGYLSDRFSRKAIIIPALILYGSGGLLAGAAAAWFSNSYTWIIAGRILQGMGAAGTAPIAMALAGDLFKGGEQSKVLGLVEASNGFGKVISPIIGSLLALLFWYAAFFAFPIFCAMSVLFTIFFIKEKKAEKEPPPLGKYVKGLVSVFKTEGRWLFAAYFTGASCLFTLFGILFYISDILEKDHQIDGLLKGAILAIPLLFMTTTSYFTGSNIGKKMKVMKRLIVIGCLLMTASFASLVFFTNLLPFFAVLVISSIGTGLVLPCINSFITGSVPADRRGFVTSLYGSVRFLGVAIGPPIFGALMEWSRSGMFLTTAGLTLLCGLLSMMLIHVAKKEPSEESDSLFEKLSFT